MVIKCNLCFTGIISFIFTTTLQGRLKSPPFSRWKKWKRIKAIFLKQDSYPGSLAPEPDVVTIPCTARSGPQASTAGLPTLPSFLTSSSTPNLLLAYCQTWGLSFLICKMGRGQLGLTLVKLPSNIINLGSSSGSDVRTSPLKLWGAISTLRSSL